jgi:TrpR family trp operon transcriptional repressor
MSRYFEEFINTALKLKDKRLVEDFFEGILTEQEKEEISLRLQIIKKLMAGEPQAKIAKDLGVGVATVTRGSRELKAGRFKALKAKSRS